MTNNGIPRLCGGTFFMQLLQSRKQTATQRQRTQGVTDVFHNEDVLFELLKIINPNAVKPSGTSFEIYTTNFKKCDGSIGEDLRFGNETILSKFKSRLNSEYASLFSSFVNFCVEFLDTRETPQNHVKLVKRLIELIRDDVSIDDKEMFQIGENGYRVNKKALVKATEVSLPDFLLSIWAFVVLHRNDNSIGKKTIIAWSDPRTKGRYIGNDGSSITQEIQVTMPQVRPSQDKAVDREDEDEPSEEYNEPVTDEPAPNPVQPPATINAPIAIFNTGAGVEITQINNTGTMNIYKGGKK